MTKRVVLGACPHDCPDTCSMLVTVQDDRVTEVRGNPAHPFTRGGLCVKVDNYQERVYSKDRVLFPLRRTGPKGASGFERITWDEALETIASKWTSIIDRQGPTAILPYSYLGTEGILNGLNAGDAFFNKLGATISERTFCDSGACTGYIMTVGPSPGTDPETFKHSKYIVLWAINPISTNLHHWPIIKEAQKNGAKVVVIDPVKSRTAQAADWHLPIKPGTDGALALGLIHEVIAQNLVDRDYVDEYTVGYEQLAERAAGFSPDRVAEITGLDAADISRLAREFATTQPSVIRIGVAIERHSGGGQTVRALTCLPALTGSWRHVGGGILQLPIWAFPVKWDDFMRPDWISPGTRVVNQWRLGAALTGELALDPPIESLFVYNSNPAVVAAEQQKVLAGLAREDLFTVVSEQFMTDTARFADLVLPATTQLEQLDIMFSWGHFYLSLNQPAIEPLGEAVPNTELFRRLAKAMGFDDPQFTRTDEEMVAGALDWSSPALSGITLDELKANGFARLRLQDPDTYAPHAQGNFLTPSGKCEFVASMAANGSFVLPLFRQGSNDHQSGKPFDPVPDYIPPHESPATNPDLAAKYPLNLISPKSHAFLNSQYGNLERQMRRAGTQHILLHPDDAAARNLDSGQKVKVYNDRGAFTASVDVSTTVRAGVAVAPLGYWAQTSGGFGVNAVNSDRTGDLGENPTFSDTLVQVEAI